MKLNYMTLGGEKHPICFSLSAICEIEDEFGSLDKMMKSLQEGKVRTVAKVMDIMLRAGRAYCEGMGIECPPPLKCKPGDLIDITDQTVVKEIFGAINNDMERTVETKKN